MLRSELEVGRGRSDLVCLGYDRASNSGVIGISRVVALCRHTENFGRFERIKTLPGLFLFSDNFSFQIRTR